MPKALKRKKLEGVAAASLSVSSSTKNNRNVVATTAMGRINSLSALMNGLDSSSVDTELDSSSVDSVDYHHRSTTPSSHTNNTKQRHKQQQ